MGQFFHFLVHTIQRSKHPLEALIPIDSKLFLQVGPQWLPQVLTLKNHKNHFNKMLQTFNGNGFCSTTILVGGICCNIVCQHFQNGNAFLDH
jgi:hypothetical protein